MRAIIEPAITKEATSLVQAHQDAGDTVLIITATNSFITEPIAKLLDVDDLLATEPEMIDGRYTGRIKGTPCFQAGKQTRLQEWRKAQSEQYSHLTFYSDSHNDLPLLRAVDQPVAVDPDAELLMEATRCKWPVISLREPLPSL